MESEPIEDTVVSEIDNHREKRVRKSVSRLSDVYDKTFDLKSERINKPVTGNGTKLGDIKRIQDACQRSKVNGELAKNMHLLCYRSIGKAGKRLIEIKKFNGFNENDETEFKRRLTLVDKMKLDELKQICDLLNVHPSGKTKKDISLGIVDYLKAPFETGSEAFRTSSLRKKIKKGKTGRKKVVEGKRKGVESDSSVDKMDSSISDVEMESEEQIEKEEEEELESVDLKKSDKKTRKIKEKNAESDRKAKKPKKEKSEEQSEKSRENENGEVETNEKHSISSLSQSNDLSDEVLKEKISAILSGADLSKITLNQVCDGVVEQFPDVDLVLRRPYIKSLVKQVLDQAS